MINVPNFGETVAVWPSPGQKIQDGAGQFGRFLQPAGRSVVWDEYWHRRFLEGAVLFHDPISKKKE